MSDENYKHILIYKTIFSYVTEKRKLDLIIYNKKIQYFCNISLINYIFKSGKYKEGEKNGKGKEFNFDGELIFEGEYLNGKKNGKGKEYNEKGDLIFEGEYLNGKKNGKGKEYNNKGKLIFEGEYLNGNAIQ